MAEHAVFDREKITRIKTLLKFNPKGLTITEISQKLKLSRISVSKYLDILLISGQVEMKMYGVAKAFFLSSRVPISAMLSFSSDFILILDNDLQILQINDNFLKFLGVEKTTLLGNSISHPSLQFLKELPLQPLLEKEVDQKENNYEVSTLHEDTQYYFRAKVIPTVFDDGSQGLTIILENITENKQSDKIKSFLAAIVESSNEGIIGKDLDGTILSWNRAAESMYGYRADEIIGQNIAVLVPDAQKRDLSQILDRVKKGETITQLETRRKRKNGEMIDVLLTISPIRDETGSIIAIATISKDVTDVNRLREELRIKMEKLHEIVEFLPDPTFIVDRNKNVLGWNKALEEFTGIKKQDMLGKNAVDRMLSISGTYRPLLIDFLNQSNDKLPPIYTAVKKTKDSISAELYLPKKKAYIWVKASPLYDQDGNFIGGIETFKDITEWKTSEQSLKDAQETMAKALEDRIRGLIDENVKLMDEIEGYRGPLNTRILLEKSLDITNQRIMINDNKGQIKYVSDAMASHLGIASRHELIDTNIFNIIDTSSRQSILDLLLKRKDGAINIRCSFSTNQNKMTTPFIVSLLIQDEDILGFVIGDPEGLAVFQDGREAMGGRMLQDGRTKQLLSQILLITPFLTILPDLI
jgi:PAS domain S-box-containing protein